MLQAVLTTIHYWLTIVASFLACVLLLGAARWLAQHMHEIASYRSPWLTFIEDWFVRLVWLSLGAGYLVLIIHTPDMEEQLMLVGFLLFLAICVVVYWGIHYWYYDGGFGFWYETHHEKNPKRTELIASITISTFLFASLFLWWLFIAPFSALVLYGTWKHFKLRKNERDEGRFITWVAHTFEYVLRENHMLGSFVYECERVSPCTIRLRAEVSSEPIPHRIEEWLRPDIEKAMGARRMVLRVVTDKSDFENPDARTIIDVWVQYPSRK